MDLSMLANPAASADELRERLEPVVFELLWQAKDRLSRLSAVEQAASFLREQGVVGAMHTATPVHMGLKATLVLATVDGDMLRAVAGSDGATTELSAEGDHEEWAQLLAAKAGALVLLSDHEGPRMVGGDEDSLAEALEAFPEGDALSAPVNGAAYWGQQDQAVWERTLGEAEAQEPGAGSGYALHRDAVIYTGSRPVDAVPGSLVEVGPVVSPEGEQAWSTTPRPATLMVQDRGGWVALSFTPRLSPNADSGDEHVVEAQHLLAEGAVLTATAGLGHTLFPETGQGARIAELLAQDFLGMNEDDEAELVHAIGPVRAAEVVRSLSGMAQGRRVAEGRLAGQEWLGELRDTVEMLGFDPTWVGVLAGSSRAPEPGAPLVPVPVEAQDSPAQESPLQDSSRPDPAGQAPEPAVTGSQPEAPAAATPPTKQSQAAYAIVVVELIIGAVFLFFRPLPWEAANLGVAALAIVVGVAHLWRTEKRHRAQQPPQSGA